VAESLVIRPKRLGWVLVGIYVVPGFVLSLAMVFPNALAPVIDFLDLEHKSVGVAGAAYQTDGVALDLLLRRWRLKYGR
jgi:hypothetical protein